MFATLLNWQFSQNLKQKHADFKLFNVYKKNYHNSEPRNKKQFFFRKFANIRTCELL